MAPMRERLRSTDVLGDVEARKRALEGLPDLTIRMEHLEAAIEKTKPSVSEAEVEKYLQWRQEFGAQ